MCFRKIKINGVRYSLSEGEKVVAKLVEELATAKSALEAADSKVATLTQAKHKLSYQNGQLKAEIAKLQEQLADFPARSKSGKDVKRNQTTEVEQPKTEE